jgi:hypothetical protein
MKILTKMIYLVATVILIWYLFFTNDYSCPIKQFTGFSCPGCGYRTALICLFHGDIKGAFEANMLWILWTVLMVWLAKKIGGHIFSAS